MFVLNDNVNSSVYVFIHILTEMKTCDQGMSSKKIKPIFLLKQLQTQIFKHIILVVLVQGEN